MQRLSTKPKYTYKHGNVSFIFDSFTYESGTKVSEYEVLTNGLSSAINGTLPTKITLKGKFLAEDYEELEDYIFSNAGEVISQISINGRSYSRMTLLNATVSLPASSHIGDMTFILQRVV